MSHKSQHETGCGDGTTIDMSSARLAGTLSVWVTSCAKQVLATALLEEDRTLSGCRAGLVLDPAG